MKKNRWLLTAGGILALLVLLPFSVAAAPQQQGENLLNNPSFEGGYSAWSGIPQIQMPSGWTPWWTDRSGDDPDWMNHRPEWKPAEGEYYPNRVHGGTRAIQWFKSYATYNCGAYQQVSVPANAQLRFSAYGQGWSCDDFNNCKDATSHDPANMRMQIGIDPTGGTNPWAGTVVWSVGSNPLDAWGYLQVDATAQGSAVTVFLKSNPDWPKQNQDSYFDDASLVVIGQGDPAPQATEAPDPESQPAPVVNEPTEPFVVAAPQADGSIVHTVAANQTLWMIAANYGVSVDQVRANNDIGAFIYVGQQLVIQSATGDAVPEEPTPEPTPEPTEDVGAADGGGDEPQEEAEPTEEPETETVVEEIAAADPAGAAGGSICVTAYDDQNANGFQDDGENKVPGILISLSDAQNVLGNYTTDGISEPYCFSELVPGTYQVTEQVGGSRVATTLAAWGISLQAGDIANIHFGSAVAQAAPATENTADTVDTAGEAAAVVSDAETEDADQARLRTSIFTGLGVFGLLLIVGAGAFIVLARRR